MSHIVIYIFMYYGNNHNLQQFIEHYQGPKRHAIVTSSPQSRFYPSKGSEDKVDFCLRSRISFQGHEINYKFLQ